MMRVNGALVPVDWEVALAAAAEGLQSAAKAHGADGLGFLAAPMATLEELFLLAQIARGLGSSHIDHRLRQLDFRAQDNEGAYPSIGMEIADIEALEGVLVVGSNLRQEMPLLAHRLRKAVIKGGAKVAFLNPRRYDYLFPVAAYLAEADLVRELSAVLRAAAAAASKPVPPGVPAAAVSESHRALAAALSTGTHRAVLLGTLAQRHPAYAQLKALAAQLAELTDAVSGMLTEGANAAGAYLSGAVPHRLPGAVPNPAPGLDARAMLETPRKGYVLLGGIDPAADFAVGADALAAADFTLAITTHLSDYLRAQAHVVLPIGSFAETSGTFVNIEGRWQSWAGAAKLVGESRPGWKVLRVLGNLLSLPGFDYVSSEEIREVVKLACGTRLASPGARPGAAPVGSVPGSWVDVPPYAVDALVRRSDALSKTRDGQSARIVI
jgi:NADH-quinone oxidoreductase subunit G